MEKQPGSRMCFICGRQNPVGLKADIYNDLDHRQVSCELVIGEEYQGYPGVVHGGIVAALLDEISGRAILLESGPENLMVTLKLEIRYRKPTPTHTPLLIVGTLVQLGKARAKVHGEIRLADGTVTAEAEAVVVRPPDSVRAAWADEQPYWKVYDS